MSLGQDLAPHVPSLRQYARMLFGTELKGDEIVSVALQSIVDDPSRFAFDVDVRVALYSLFHEHVSISEIFFGFYHNDDLITPAAKSALLLQKLEGFSIKDISYILGMSVVEIHELIQVATRFFDRKSKARIFIIEDDPIIAMDLSSIIEDLGHDVVGVAATRQEAVRQFRTSGPTLVLADIQLADDSSGIDAVAEIQKIRRVPVIFITAFPERLLTGDRPEPTYLITKPFQRQTVREAITQALFINDLGYAPPDPALEPAPTNDTDPPASAQKDEVFSVPIGQGASDSETQSNVSLFTAEDFEQVAAPIVVQVENGQVRAAASRWPQSRLSYDTLNQVTQDKAIFAAQMVVDFADTNGARDAVRWMRTLESALGQPLTEASAIRFEASADCILGMEAELREQLLPTAAASFLAFAREVRNLASQFYEIRAFRMEADDVPMAQEDVDALSHVATVIADQPGEMVSPEVADVMREASELVTGKSPIQKSAARSAVANVLRAIASWLLTVTKNTANKTAEKISEQVSDWVITLSGVAITAYLAQLSTSYPALFSGALTIFALKAISQSKGK